MVWNCALPSQEELQQHSYFWELLLLNTELGCYQPPLSCLPVPPSPLWLLWKN